MNVSFGRYLPVKSIVHHIDPRIKLLVLITIISCILIKTGFTGYSIVGAVVIFIFLFAKLPIMLLWRLLLPMVFMTFFIFLISIFFSKDMSSARDIGLLWQWKFISISKSSIFNSIYIGVRIYLMILVTTILTSTTQPLDLTLALEDLMAPLKLIRFPVHIISMIISIALRSIPTLFDEANKILKAQASRGVDMRNGHFREKSKALVSLIIPLLVASFQKAEDLAHAMDSRGYDPQGKRSRFRQYHINVKDICFFFVGAGLLTFVIIYAYFPSLIANHLRFSFDNYIVKN